MLSWKIQFHSVGKFTGFEYGPAPTLVYATTRALYVAPVVRLCSPTDNVLELSVICARIFVEFPALT